MPSDINCVAINDPVPYCSIENTVYGYYPNLGANAFFCAFFAVLCIVQIFLGIKYKTWTFMVALGLGCLAEAIGYAGRVIMHSNPYSNAGFESQICCLILAPAFIAAGVYLTLKHVVIALGRDFSRLRPKFYTWIFICCDFLSLVMQAIGGATAATANTDATAKIGGNVMLAGIVIQVVTLLVFAALSTDFFLSVRKNVASLHPEATALRSSTRFNTFLTLIGLAFITVFIRCVYRIPELADGWASSIMQNETLFIVLDGVMISTAALALTVGHPGFMFPQMKTNRTEKREKKASMGTTVASESDIEKAEEGPLRA
ncbi:hypothetical protein MMC25_000701 [Agyrium rufum]|nr:hypothetical protein [Agyrium rufum]